MFAFVYAIVHWAWPVRPSLYVVPAGTVVGVCLAVVGLPGSWGFAMTVAMEAFPFKVVNLAAKQARSWAP